MKHTAPDIIIKVEFDRVDAAWYATVENSHLITYGETRVEALEEMLIVLKDIEKEEHDSV